jgi:hypothetical protein
MKFINRTALAVLAITLLASPAAKASRSSYDGPCGYGTGHSCTGRGSGSGSGSGSTPSQTPEIDPSMAVGALVVIGGVIVAIRGRRRKS